MIADKTKNCGCEVCVCCFSQFLRRNVLDISASLLCCTLKHGDLLFNLAGASTRRRLSAPNAFLR